MKLGVADDFISDHLSMYCVCKKACEKHKYVHRNVLSFFPTLVFCSSWSLGTPKNKWEYEGLGSKETTQSAAVPTDFWFLFH